MGITGKMALWKTLAELDTVDAERTGVDFARMAARAAEQRSAVEDLHRLASSGLASQRPL